MGTRREVLAVDERAPFICECTSDKCLEAVTLTMCEFEAAHMSRNGIAESFNRQGVPTAAGGKAWYASTIQRVTDPGK